MLQSTVFRPVYLVNGVIKVLKKLFFHNSTKQIVYFIQLALIVIYLVWQVKKLFENVLITR